jgi:hypothetical protein
LDTRRQQVFNALGTIAENQNPDLTQGNALTDLPPNPHDTVFGRFERENLPAIGATIATLARRGKPVRGPRGLPTGVTQAINRAIAKPAAGVLAGAGRAAIGGGVGGLAQTGTQTPATDRFVDNAIEQGIADPLARLTLGFSKFLLRPAGKVAAAQVERVMAFARKNALAVTKEGLALDPGRITGSAIPKMISTFARGFFGSTVQSRAKLRAIAEHISSDPETTKGLFRVILKEGPGMFPAGGRGQFLADAQEVVVGVARRLGKKATPLMKRAAEQAGDAGKAAEFIFRDAATATQAKANMTRKQWNNLVTSHVADMVERASKDGIIDGDVLGSILKANRTNLSQFYPRGLLDRLQNLAVYSKAHKGVLEEVLETPFLNQRAFRTNIISGAVAGTTLAAGADPTGVSASVIGLSTILASQVFNPNSITSKWLTTGLIPKNVAAKVAADVAANVLAREAIGDVVTDTGVTEAVREGDPRPLQDRVGGFVDRRVQDVKERF